jgi:hypothetical protein
MLKVIEKYNIHFATQMVFLKIGEIVIMNDNE